jgi:hypothetical protein
MSSIQQRLNGEVAKLRKQYPNAVAHADNTAVIAPRDLANRIHHLFTGSVFNPIFIPSPGNRTLVVPRLEGGGVDYVTVPMEDTSLASNV